MSTRAERKRRRNARRCRNCGEFGSHYIPWTLKYSQYICHQWQDRKLHPGELNTRGEVG